MGSFSSTHYFDQTPYFPPSRDAEDEAVEAAFGDIGSRGFDFPPEYAKADVGWAGEEEADEEVAEA